MIRYSLSLFFLVLVALVFQQFIPPFSGLYNARVLLVTLVFLCSSVTVGPPTMLVMAFLCGFLQDAQNAVFPRTGDPQVYVMKVEQLGFGYSILLYAAVGYLMQGIQPLFRQGKWHISTLIVGISVFAYLILEYLLINFFRGGFVFTEFTLRKIAYSSGITMLFAPLVFWVLHGLASAYGHTIRFEGLKTTTPAPSRRF